MDNCPQLNGKSKADNCPAWSGKETRDIVAERAGFSSGTQISGVPTPPEGDRLAGRVETGWNLPGLKWTLRRRA